MRFAAGFVLGALVTAAWFVGVAVMASRVTYREESDG